jgi:hypothetical protein
MTWATTAAADIDAIVGDQDNAFRATLVWGAQTAYGSASDLDDKSTPSIPGFVDEADLEWIGKVSQFTDSTPPSLRAAVTVKGVAMIVTSKPIVAQDGITVTLRLKRR